MMIQKNRVSDDSIVDYFLRSMLFICLMCAPMLSSAQEANVDKAVDFLKKACVTTGSSLELKASVDGSLKVRSILGSGVEGSVTLTKKELEGFADAASALNAQQASEMRECMKPYIDKIISVLLSGSVSGEPKAISINTSGSYFVTKEFDDLMVKVSERPSGWWSVDEISRKTGLHPAKVSSYFQIANDNGMGHYGSNFMIGKKGINYVLSRGLVQ